MLSSSNLMVAPLYLELAPPLEAATQIDHLFVFRDIGVRAWYDYLAWSNPTTFTSRVHIGRARCKAGSAVLVRYKKDTDLVPSVILGSLLTAAYALSKSPELMIGGEQLIYVGIIGFVLVPFAFVILTIAPRYANSAEVQLVYLLVLLLLFRLQ